jgi:hypothetical protein
MQSTALASGSRREVLMSIISLLMVAKTLSATALSPAILLRLTLAITEVFQRAADSPAH